MDKILQDVNRRGPFAALLTDNEAEATDLVIELSRPRGPSDAKRHHYVPQFYLKGFAGRRGSVDQIVTIPNNKLDEGRPGSVADTAVISNFYTFTPTGEGEASVSVERLLSSVEAKARNALARLALGRLFPPQPTDRLALACFLALQFVRGPEQRRSPEASGDMILQIALSKALDEDGDPIGSTTDSHGGLVMIQSDSHLLALMLDTATALVPYFYDRYYTVLEYPGGGLMTSDNPIVLMPDSISHSEGEPVGLANASEIYMPLDRMRLLVLIRDSEVGNRFFREMGPDTIDFHNQMIVDHSWAEVYCHPEDWSGASNLIGKPEGTQLMELPNHPEIVADGVNAELVRKNPRRYRSPKTS